MKNKTLHIVAFDNPFPPSYGGVIDIFYKLKTLHESGLKIILHVFLYDGKEPNETLVNYCQKIHYYNRKRFTNPFTGEMPYIVATRNDEQLLINLKKDKHPILFEGLHTTYFLGHPALKDRQKIVRTHNVEHVYYKSLEAAESGFFKKYFFRVESERLAQYENTLEHADIIAAISPLETSYYKSKFENTAYIPAFHSNDTVLSKTGKGKFILYHGNLGVGENNVAALFLIHEVFSKLKIPVVIAGNNASRQLRQAAKGYEHISLVDKISSSDILELVSEAQINVLVTFQNTGIKLKLLNGLFRGRHCIVNPEMIADTGLEDLCLCGSKADQLVQLINQQWDISFSASDVLKRKQVLGEQFENKKSAESILNLLKY